MEKSEFDFSLLKHPLKLDYSSLLELKHLLDDEKTQFITTLNTPFNNISNHIADEIRLRFSGKKSPLQNWLKGLKILVNEERKNAGSLINELKFYIDEKLQFFLDTYQKYVENEKLSNERDDISLLCPEISLGSRHPVVETLNIIIRSLCRRGFVLIDGPEIDHEFYNFDALNTPKNHPAREVQDTMFIASEWVLRTQTSNVQTHAMIERGVPLRVICPGYVYRVDYDATHIPCFRQIECLVVDKNINMGHLRYTLKSFLSEIFGREVKTRFRSSFFPFTEPSGEFDVECQQCHGLGCRSCKNTGWSELGGFGMINRNVLRSCNVNPDEYSGFAFGFGLDRLAMSKFSIDDLRSMSLGDINLAQILRK